MAAISLRRHDDHAAFIDRFAGDDRYVMDYLIEEVLDGQSGEVRRFLLETSVLHRLKAGLCDAVTEASGSQRILEYLEEHGLFCFPVDDTRTWFRYHQLFADLLIHQLRTEVPGKDRELLLRAASWHEEEGMLDEGFRYACGAEEFDLAADLVRRHGPGLLGASQIPRLLAWLDRLPEAVVGGSPELGVIAAWALALSGRHKAADAQLDVLAMPDEGARSDETAGQVAAIRAFTAAYRGDAKTTVELARQALVLLPDGEATVRSAATFSLGMGLLNLGRFDDATRAFREAAEYGEAGANYYAASSAHFSIGVVEARTGDLGSANDARRTRPRPCPRRIGWRRLGARQSRKARGDHPCDRSTNRSSTDSQQETASCRPRRPRTRRCVG